MPPNDPLDLDLIRMVQQARMAHDADAVPSEVAGVYWVEAKRKTVGHEPTPRAGVFVISTTQQQIDALWATIKQATWDGKLGYKSKAATASRSMGVDQTDRVIHVLTYDADDTADVARVRAALIELGVTANVAFRRQDGSIRLI